MWKIIKHRKIGLIMSLVIILFNYFIYNLYGGIFRSSMEASIATNQVSDSIVVYGLSQAIITKNIILRYLIIGNGCCVLICLNGLIRDILKLMFKRIEK